MELLLEPLSHAFMLKALMISALVGGVCGLLSCFMTLKGWALMGDAVSHAAVSYTHLTLPTTPYV